MSIYRIVLIIDDSIPAQATLVGQIQNTLASIASNLPQFNVQHNIEVKKLA